MRDIAYLVEPAPVAIGIPAHRIFGTDTPVQSLRRNEYRCQWCGIVRTFSGGRVRPTHCSPCKQYETRSKVDAK